MRGAPEGVAMGELEPESQEILAYYWQHIDKHSKIADDCRIPRFSAGLRRDLFALLSDNDAVRLLEVVTRIGNFGDADDLASLGKSVSRLLKARGVKMPRGKRTAPGLLKLVARLTPLMLHFGLPLATSERSRLVSGLRMIAEEVGVNGDPRDELRRLRRIKLSHDQFVRKVVYEAMAKGFAPLKVNNPR